MSYTSTERILGRFIDEHNSYPPFEVCLNYDIICSNVNSDHPKVLEALYSILEVIAKLLPESYHVDFPTLMQQKEAHSQNRQGLTIPLYEVINVPKVIIEILWQFYHGLEDEGYAIRKKLQENENAIFGLSQYARRIKGVPLPTTVDMPPDDLAYAYLRGTPLERLFNTPVPFTIARQTWASHAFFAAPSGHGKSQLAGTILREAIEDPEPRALIVIDPHGKKKNSLFELAVSRVPPERLVVIDPDTNPPDVGLLDFGVLDKHSALETFLFLMSSMAGGLSAKQQTSIPSLFELLSLIPNASFVTLHELITERPSKPDRSKYASVIEQLEDIHQDFFNNLWFKGTYDETRNSLQWKLLAALGRPAFKKMFSATRNSINMDAFLRQRKIVVINGGEQALGKEGMRIFVLFLIGQYYAAAKRRREQHLAMCIVDEASYAFQSTVIADILAELRGYGCAFAGWTQHWAQVAAEVKPAVLGNTAIKGVGALQHNDATVIGREIFMPVEKIRGLKPFTGLGSHSEWAIFIAGMDKAQIVSLPYGGLERMEKINPNARSTYEMPKQEGDTYKEVSPSQPVATGAHKAPRTVTNTLENASEVTQSDRDILIVVKASAKLEDLLARRFGATGDGFGQKFNSVKDRMPAHLHHPAKRFANIRNLQIHVVNFVLYPHTRKRFIEYAKLLEDYFTQPDIPSDDPSCASPRKY